MINYVITYSIVDGYEGKEYAHSQFQINGTEYNTQKLYYQIVQQSDELKGYLQRMCIHSARIYNRINSAYEAINAEITKRCNKVIGCPIELRGSKITSKEKRITKMIRLPSINDDILYIECLINVQSGTR